MKNIAFILLFHICLLPKMLSAQETDNESVARFRIGSGVSFPAKNQNVFINGSAGCFFLPFKYLQVGLNLNGGSDLGIFVANSHSLVDVQLLSGFTLQADFFYFSASTGISYISGSKDKVTYNSYTGQNDVVFQQFSGIGLPLDFDIGVKVTKREIVSATLNANINNKQKFHSFLGCVNYNL